MIIEDVLADAPGIRHAFFTREGGVSTGVYASLNCALGSADDPAAVRANRQRAMARLGLGPESLVTAYQVHSREVAVVTDPWSAEARPEVDGLVTNRPGLALGILTADCAPVLLADPEAGVIGAAHAGWRGARAGIIEATVEAMVGLGARPERTRAAVGPCIGRESYEVGPEFRAAFGGGETSDGTLFKPSQRDGRLLFDLTGYVAGRLAALSLAAIGVSANDTCADDTRFFSYRRTTLNGGGDYGRLLSAIAIEP